MSLYKGNNLISGHQVLYSTTGNNTDGAMTQDATTSELNNKANINLSNLTATSSTNFDGQWVNVGATIMDKVNLHGTTALTYTLSLPNDGYNYEVLLSGSIVTGTTSGNALILQVYSSLVGNTFMCWTTNRGTTGASARSGGNVIIPVSSNHNIYVTRANDYTGTASLYMRAYRRIGTNA